MSASMIDRPLEDLIKDQKKQKVKKTSTDGKKPKGENKKAQSDKKPAAKPKQAQKGAEGKPKQQGNKQQNANGSVNKQSQQKNDNAGQNKQQNQKKHPGTGGHLAKVRAGAESKGPQQKQNKFKVTDKPKEKQQKKNESQLLDNLKITVENDKKVKEQPQQAADSRGRIFKNAPTKQKPNKPQKQQQGNSEDIRISVANQPRQDVKSQSMDAAAQKERQRQKAASSRKDERAQEMHERRVVTKQTQTSGPKTLSERWGNAPKAPVPAATPGSRVVYISPK